jgi:CBS domain-containing protein
MSRKSKPSQSVRSVMTVNPIGVEASAPAVDAARMMRDRHIGAVVVREGDQFRGLLTDRDIVVRAIAEGRDPAATRVSEICSREIATVRPEDSVDEAIRVMRQKTVRRLPVLEDGRAVGIVSLGDLAVERDRRSVLGEISGAPPNQ